MDARTIPGLRLEELTASLLEAAGTPPDLATLVARHLVGTNLTGHDSHGVLRIPWYLELIAGEKIVPDARPEVVRELPGAAVGSMAAAVKAVDPAPGVEQVLLPGEPEARTRAAGTAQGIAGPADTWKAIAAAARSVGIDVEAPAGIEGRVSA